jgi:hypothetical protein
MAKFLDNAGVEHLWKTLIENYPNHDTLTAVINAIDSEKADRSDLDNYLLKEDYTGGGGSSSITYEDWTFVLTDGSTVTKRVAIG